MTCAEGVCPQCVLPCGLSVSDAVIAADHPADIFQKLSAVEEQRRWVIESGAHKVKGQSRLGDLDPVSLESNCT